MTANVTPFAPRPAQARSEQTHSRSQTQTQTRSPAQSALPTHVAVIMDGNGRWARRHGLARQKGHHKGMEVMRQVIEHAKKRGVRYLTLYTFSTENWERPAGEVNFLMALARDYIQQYLDELARANIKIIILGKGEGLPDDIRTMLAQVCEATKHNNEMVLQIAFNYGSWQEATDMVRHVATKVAQGAVSPDEINADMVRAHLMTANSPDPDMIIRTGGEFRLSNFLLLQSAYAELIFQPILWPDYQASDFDDALQEFTARERRFGGVSAGDDIEVAE